MKKLIFIFGLILFSSCTTSTLEGETENPESGKDRVVKMEFNTTLLGFDEIRISYFDYRNNPSTEEISVKVYVDDELVIEEAERGKNGEYAEIRFNYDIVLKKNI